MVADMTGLGLTDELTLPLGKQCERLKDTYIYSY